jgi:hypothetical protein
VLAAVEYYIRQAIEWCKMGPVSVFTETKTVADLSFNQAYKVPDQMDNVVDLATKMFFLKDLSQLVKETYLEVLIP